MKTEVIAEIGVNHQNDIGIAHQLISFAREAGATAAKFQCSTVVEEVSFKHAREHFIELGRLVPTTRFLRQCEAMCRAEGIEFLCTPSGTESLKLVLDMGVARIKVASDNIDNIPFLDAVSDTGLPVILSTGMATMSEVHTATQMLRTDDITVLHCVSAYPAPLDQTNLLAMQQLRAAADKVGLSDHSESVIVPAMAVALGAVMIEKHITLDRTLEGPDHRASLDPLDFGAMMFNIREAEAALGDGVKKVMPCEVTGRQLYRKSLVAKVPIKAGEHFTEDNVTLKRPASGMNDWGLIIGHVATVDYEEDDQIK